MRQRSDYVLGKILRYAEHCVTRRVIMGAAANCWRWLGGHDAVSQSCKDFHVKTALTVYPGRTNSLWMTPYRSKK